MVVVEKVGEPVLNYDDFAASLPANECRYAIFDYDFVTEENCQKSKIFFIAWYYFCVSLINFSQYYNITWNVVETLADWFYMPMAKVSWYIAREKQDDLRELQGQVQEGARRHSGGAPGDRSNGGWPRRDQRPCKLSIVLMLLPMKVWASDENLESSPEAMGYDFVIILVLLLSKGRCKAVIYVRCNDKAILSAFDHDILSLFDSFSLASMMQFFCKIPPLPKYL